MLKKIQNFKEINKKWHYITCSWIGRLNIVRMSSLLQTELYIQRNLKNNSSRVFGRIWQTDSKHMEKWRAQNGQNKLEKEK